MEDEIVKVELRGDIPIMCIVVPYCPEFSADSFWPELEEIEYWRCMEYEGLEGMKFVHFRREDG